MAGSPISAADNELVSWLSHFGAMFESYAASLGFTPAEVSASRMDINFITCLFNVRLPAARQTQVARVALQEFTDLMKHGDAAAPLPATLPGSVLPRVYPGSVTPGVMTRLRKLVQNIKSRPGYTVTIGQDLGIVATSRAASPEATSLALVKAKAGQTKNRKTRAA